MIRDLCADDRRIYMELSEAFYSSDAVLHPVPEEFRAKTFEEMMRSDLYAQGFILERDGNTAGYGIISKSFSQEAGGLVVWLEELYLLPQYRSMGLGTEFFSHVEAHVPAARYRLEIEPENTRAAALYTRLGYKPLPYCQMIKE